MRLEVKLASLYALDVVRGKPTRICPLQCDRGYKAQGDSCVKITCGANQTLGDDGTCQVKQERTRAVAKPEPKPRQADAPSPAAAKAPCVFDRTIPAGTSAQSNSISCR